MHLASYHTGSRTLIYSSLLFQWMLWNLKGISRDQWCMLLGIFVWGSHLFQPFLRFDYFFLSSAYAFLSLCEYFLFFNYIIFFVFLWLMLHVYFLFQTSYNNISHTNLTEIYRTLRIPAFASQGLLVLDNLSSCYHIQADNDCYVLNCMLFNLKI